MCIHYDRIHHQKPSTSCLGFMLRLSEKCCRLEHLRFRGKYRVAMNTAYRFMRATIAVDYVRSVNGHTHGKYCGGSRLVRYPFGWSDNYAVCEPFSLWGSTVVVVSSMPGLHGPGLRGLPDSMGAHRLHSTLTPTILPQRT